MKKRIIVSGLILCLLDMNVLARVYTLQDISGGSQRRLRLNIPPDIDVVRGILIYGNGAGGDSTARATDPELVAYARSIGFVVLATGYWGLFGRPDDSELLLFEDMLQEFAEQSMHPELIHAPWLPLGHSNGGQMSYGLNAKRPDKVIGFITSKGCCYNTFQPPTASLKTPGMLIAGQLDTVVRRNNIRALFESNRMRGALWAWVEEQGSGHEEKDAQQLKLTFLAECVRLRYPPGGSPAKGPVPLKDLHECEGWLVDHTSWKDGPTRIYAYDEAPGDVDLYGWVPNERMARYYQAFSSYDKASLSVTGSSGVVTAPVDLTYTVRVKHVEHRIRNDPALIEFFFNGIPTGSADLLAGEPATITVEQTVGGLAAFTGLVTYERGNQGATYLRRVFVQGVRPPSAFEQWALENDLPTDLGGPQDSLFEDGVTNLERFAFGLDPTEPQVDFQPLNPADPLTESINGSDYVVYTYNVNERARNSGLNVMPQVSIDQENWTNIVTIRDPWYGLVAPIVDREGQTLTVKYPQAEHPLYFRLAVSDTYEGVQAAADF